MTVQDAVELPIIVLIAGPPVEVGVTMYVLSISSVSEVLMVLKTLNNRQAMLVFYLEDKKLDVHLLQYY